MTHHLFTGKAIILASMAAATAPVAATVVSADIHWDLTTVITAVITGVFGTVQVYMLSKLHTMVNSQQTALNMISRRDAMAAATAEAGALGETRGRMLAAADAAAAAAVRPITVTAQTPAPEPKKE